MVFPGDTRKSIECFRRALAVSPNNADILLNLARVLFNLQYLDDAIFLTRRSLEVQPPDQNAWMQHFQLGEILKAYCHYQEAALHLRHVLELKPNYGPALSALQDMETLPDSTVHMYTILIIGKEFKINCNHKTMRIIFLQSYSSWWFLLGYCPRWT